MKAGEGQEAAGEEGRRERFFFSRRHLVVSASHAFPFAPLLFAVLQRPTHVHAHRACAWAQRFAPLNARGQRNSAQTHNPRPTPLPSHFSGVLACLDGYMNIAMEQTEVRVGERENCARVF